MLLKGNTIHVLRVGTCLTLGNCADRARDFNWKGVPGQRAGGSGKPGELFCLRETAATAWEKRARSCPHSRRGLTPLWRFQKYPQIHVSTGEESSGSGPDSTQGLRPRHRRERNHERPPSNTHDDWPSLRPPQQVPEVPVVTREHLLKLGNIQEPLHSRRHEAHFR